MRIALLTNEYPPHVYGGAGVHVEYLSRELSQLNGCRHSVQVLCFGDQQERRSGLSVTGVDAPCHIGFGDPRHEKVAETLLRDLVMAAQLQKADVLHCHTWYTHFAGCVLKQLLKVPLVLTTHSLEPHRPWKEEQLGSAYGLSSWIERTAYENADGVIAVSNAMRRDVHELYGVPLQRVRVIHNGIDPDQYRSDPDRSVLSRFGILPDKPFVLFVGRITRQKGLTHLIEAIRFFQSGVQVVLCAGTPDTEELGRETEARLRRARTETENEIVWIPEFISKEEAIRLYSLSTLFVCPSIYEPFGIINLEAMACGTPVVASAVGGIPEVVVHGETGLLVPFEPKDAVTAEPRDPERYAQDLASAVNTLLRSPETLQEMGRRARRRIEEHFSWKSIAEKTVAFYEELFKSAHP